MPRRICLWFSLLPLLLTGLPASPPPKLALSQVTVAGCSLPNFEFEGAMRQLLELGFAGAEIAVFVEKPNPSGDTYPFVVAERLAPEQKTRLQALLRQFRHLTAHLPYGGDVRPMAANPELRAKAREQLRRGIEDSAFWGAQLVNIHVFAERGVAFAAAKSELVAMYRELGAQAARHGMRLAIETTPPYRVAEYLELIAAIDRDNVGATVDTGHMKFFTEDLPVVGPDRATPEGIRRYNDLLLDVVTRLGPKLFHLHLDDVRAADWLEHFVPGTGIVDWPRLFRQLAAARYGGVMAVELLRYEGAADSGLLVTRVLTQRVRDGAPAAGLRETRAFFEKTMAAP